MSNTRRGVPEAAGPAEKGGGRAGVEIAAAGRGTAGAANSARDQSR